MAIPTNILPQHAHDHHTPQCHNYTDTRLLQGGAIAIIRPPPASPQPPSQTYKIYLRPLDLPTHPYCAILQPTSPSSNPAASDALVRASQSTLLIHSDGDLRNTSPDAPALFSLPLHAASSFTTGVPGSEEHALVVPLPAYVGPQFRLDVDARAGIIGRRVSVVLGDGEVAGMGVWGWN